MHIYRVGCVGCFLRVQRQAIERKSRNKRYRFAKAGMGSRLWGGVIGGSFSQFAGGVSHVLSDKEPHIKISVEASAGSIENTRRVNEDTEGLGVVFASEAYLGYHGEEIFAAGRTKKQYPYGDAAFYCLRPIFNTGKQRCSCV